MYIYMSLPLPPSSSFSSSSPSSPLGLTHTDNAVVSSSIRTLRIIYESGLAPSDPIFQDPSIVRLLVRMISGPPLIGQCAITIITKACQVRSLEPHPLY